MAVVRRAPHDKWAPDVGPHDRSVLAGAMPHGKKPGAKPGRTTKALVSAPIIIEVLLLFSNILLEHGTREGHGWGQPVGQLADKIE